MAKYHKFRNAILTTAQIVKEYYFDVTVTGGGVLTPKRVLHFEDIETFKQKYPRKKWAVQRNARHIQIIEDNSDQRNSRVAQIRRDIIRQHGF